jgi:hypothetical protein
VRTQLQNRIAAVVATAALSLTGAAAIAPAASAQSAAAAAFSKCMDRYLQGEKYALNLRQDTVAKAVLYTGYTTCYYDLSQRSDVNGQTEINAINNSNHYRPMAEQAIAKSGLLAYKFVLQKFALRGLGL